MNGEKNIRTKDDKLKPLLPTLRDKKRFIKIKVIPVDEINFKFDFNSVSNGIITGVMFFAGAIDYGNCGLWILKDKFDFEKQELVVRVSLKYFKKIIASLLLINSIDSKKIKIETIKVSGTLKQVCS